MGTEPVGTVYNSVATRQTKESLDKTRPISFYDDAIWQAWL